MANLMDQYVIEVEVANGFRCPRQRPDMIDLSPDATEHAGFDLLLWRRRTVVDFLQRVFNGIQVDTGPPLHSVQRKQTPFASHCAELNDFDRAGELGGQFRNSLLYFFDRGRMNIPRAR